MSDRSVRASTLTRASSELVALAAEHAARADETGRMHPDVVRAVVGAGFTRHFTPAAYGGSAGSFADLCDAVAEIATACPATAWCVSVMGSLTRMAAWLPAEGRKEVWKSSPDVVIAGSVSPHGRAHRDAAEGWVVSGTWPYVSAVEHADWLLLLAMVPTRTRPEPRVFAVPRGAYQIERTWTDIGMRATGSHTVRVVDAFVTDSLTFPGRDLFETPAPGSAADCHALPLTAVNGLFFAVPMLGAARGALRVWTAYAAEKVRGLSTGTGPGPGRTYYEETLARAAGEIDAAALLLDRIAGECDRGGPVLSVPTSGSLQKAWVARNQRDCAIAAELLLTAGDRLFRASGTAGHSATGALQRFWRDLHSASGHVVLQFGPCASSYAGMVFASDRGAGK